MVVAARSMPVTPPACHADPPSPGTGARPVRWAVGTLAAVPIRRALRLGTRVVLLVVVLVGSYLALTFVQVWQATSDDSHEPAQAIVVLGAAQYDGRPSPVLEARLAHAIELYEAGVAP